MLVLTRKLDESIILGKAGDVLTEPIEIVNVGQRSSGVRLGIKAQANIGIHRREVLDQPYDESIDAEKLRQLGFNEIDDEGTMWHSVAGVVYSSDLFFVGDHRLSHIKTMSQVRQLLNILVDK